jgi:hypothetical protein
MESTWPYPPRSLKGVGSPPRDWSAAPLVSRSGPLRLTSPPGPVKVPTAASACCILQYRDADFRRSVHPPALPDAPLLSSGLLLYLSAAVGRAPRRCLLPTSDETAPRERPGIPWHVESIELSRNSRYRLAHRAQKAHSCRR